MRRYREFAEEGYLVRNSVDLGLGLVLVARSFKAFGTVACEGTRDYAVFRTGYKIRGFVYGVRPFGESR